MQHRCNCLGADISDQLAFGDSSTLLDLYRCVEGDLTIPCQKRFMFDQYVVDPQAFCTRLADRNGNCILNMSPTIEHHARSRQPYAPSYTKGLRLFLSPKVATKANCAP